MKAQKLIEAMKTIPQDAELFNYEGFELDLQDIVFYIDGKMIDLETFLERNKVKGVSIWWYKH